MMYRQNNLIQRFFSQRWSAIALEIVMTIVITIAAGAAFDFFDPLDGEGAAAAAAVVEVEELGAVDPLEFIKQRGKDYLRERRFAAAEAMFAWAIALAPDDAQSYSWRGYVKMQAGDYRGAQADYRNCFGAAAGGLRATQRAVLGLWRNQGLCARRWSIVSSAIDLAGNRANSR